MSMIPFPVEISHLLLVIVLDIFQQPCFIILHEIAQHCPKIPKIRGGKMVNPAILDDRNYFQNQNLAENVSKT